MNNSLVEPLPAFFLWSRDNLDNVKKLLGNNSSIRNISDTLMYIWSRTEHSVKCLYIKQEQDQLKAYKLSKMSKL